MRGNGIRYSKKIKIYTQLFALIAGPMKESSEDHVTLAALSSAGLEPVLDFVYGGSLTLSEDNIEDIVAVASYLQIRCVLECCCDFMRQTLSVKNSVDYLKLASNYGLHCVASHYIHQDSLIKHIELLILEHISDLYLLNKHVRIPLFETMEKLVSSDKIQVDEMGLYNMVVDWLLAEPNRMEYCDKLMKYIRFMLMPLSDLKQIQAHPECDTVGVRDKIEKALEYVSLPVAKKVQWVSPVDQVRGKPSVLVVDASMDSKKVTVLSVSSDDDNDDSNGQRQSKSGALWIEIMQLPGDSFECSCAVSIKNFLFICGGIDVDYTKGLAQACRECHVFDLVTWQWDKIAPMNVGRYFFTLVVHEEEINAIGGRIQSDTSCTDSIEKYSLRDNCWEVVAHYHVPATDVAAVSAAGLLYMFGGQTDSENDSSSEVKSFCSLDTHTGEWKSLPLWPGADVNYEECTLLYLQNYLCFLCSYFAGCDNILCFNISTEQWVRLSPMDFHIYKLNVFLTDGHSIYCVGGCDNVRITPDIENNKCHMQCLSYNSDGHHYDVMCCWLTIPYGSQVEGFETVTYISTLNAEEFQTSLWPSRPSQLTLYPKTSGHVFLRFNGATISTQGQFWPSGIVLVCICLSCLCVHVCIHACVSTWSMSTRKLIHLFKLKPLNSDKDAEHLGHDYC